MDPTKCLHRILTSYPDMEGKYARNKLKNGSEDRRSNGDENLRLPKGTSDDVHIGFQIPSPIWGRGGLCEEQTQKVRKTE